MKACKNTSSEVMFRSIGIIADITIRECCQNVLPITINHNKTTTALRPIIGIGLIVISSLFGEYSDCVKVIGETILVNFVNDIATY